MADLSAIAYFCYNRKRTMSKSMQTKLVLVLVFTVSASGTANAGGALIEAENYTACRDVFHGLILGVEDPASSGGFKLVGLDWANEWTEYDVTVRTFGEWSAEMKCAGEVGVDYTIRMTLTGTTSGNSQSVDMTFTGAGCG